MSSVFEHLDAAVARVIGLRDELLADPTAPDRSARLAVLFGSEARAWSQFYELSSLRLVWRAALAAEAGARANAAVWAQRAVAESAEEQQEIGEDRAAGRVGATAPRPAALTTRSSSVSSGRA